MMTATCERCLASPVELTGQVNDTGELVCQSCMNALPEPVRITVLAGTLSREESRAAIMADLAPKVHDQATADMADAIADEFSQYGITGITWADPE